MSLVRTNSPLGKLIIRNLGDVGGPRSDLVDAELDNIINWAKNAVRCIRTDTSIVGNVGTGVDTLDTFSLDTPNRLTTDGDYLQLYYSGRFTASVNTRNVNATFGGTAFTTMGKVFVAGANVGWALDARIIRLSSTSVRFSSRMLMNDFYIDAAATVTSFGNAGFFEAFSGTITGLANLNSNATTITLTAEGNSNDDVMKDIAIIELRQQ